MSDSTPRPSHTTMAAGMVMGGSALVVVTVGEQLVSINSLETRGVVVEFLTTTPGTGLGVSQALVLLRIALMVVAGCATAAAVLGFHVLKRSRPARVGLSLLAVPLFLGGLATGGFLTSLVAVSTLLLWLEPSRSWFDGTPLPEPSRPGQGRQTASPWSGPTPPHTDEPTPPTDEPPPHTGTFGAAPPTVPSALPPRPVTPERRPDALVWACVLTWAVAGLAVVLLAASLTLLLADPSLIWTELERQNPDLVAESGLTREELLRTTYVTLGVCAAWSLAAIVLAVLAYRRRAAGRLGLITCASVAGAICVVASFGAALLLAPAGACLATVVLLARPDVRAWFATRQPRP